MTQEAPFALECSPTKVLDFELEDGSEPTECALHLINRGTTPVAFKVKTTKPKRYLVRPNQGVVGEAIHLPVSIVLLAQDKTDLLREYRKTGGCSETNKFMVQALPIADASAVPSDLWEKEKRRVQQKKLVVSFSFPRLSGQGQGGPSPSPSPSSGSLRKASNDVREEVAASQTRSSARNEDRARAGGVEGDGSELSQDQMWAQATALRQKYDDLVAFTINLTAEKDLIQKFLSSTKEELQREQQARKQLQAQLMEPGSRRAASVVGAPASRESRTGFSLFFVLLVAVVALFAGQYAASRGYSLLLAF